MNDQGRSIHHIVRFHVDFVDEYLLFKEHFFSFYEIYEVFLNENNSLFEENLNKLKPILSAKYEDQNLLIIMKEKSMRIYLESIYVKCFSKFEDTLIKISKIILREVNADYKVRDKYSLKDAFQDIEKFDPLIFKKIDGKKKIEALQIIRNYIVHRDNNIGVSPTEERERTLLEFISNYDYVDIVKNKIVIDPLCVHDLIETTNDFLSAICGRINKLIQNPGYDQDQELFKKINPKLNY